MTRLKAEVVAGAYVVGALVAGMFAASAYVAGETLAMWVLVASSATFLLGTVAWLHVAREHGEDES